MSNQRQADITVLLSIYARSDGRDPPRTLHRIRNSLTGGGYLAARAFDDAIDKLIRLGMVEIEGSDDDQKVKTTDHGATWIMANFHWVQGDRATLEANDNNWVMTPSEGQLPPEALRGAKKN